jgi:high-affinity iron transporter
MLAITLLVFREVLEAALIITIVLAATRSIESRLRLVGLGIVLGSAGAVLVAMFARQLSELAGGMGQELFNAGVLLAAAAMIGWHVVWMARHAATLTSQLRAVTQSVKAGDRSLFALSLLVGLAVMREGSEVVLFLFGMTAGGLEPDALIAGALVGLTAGALSGAVLYFGLLRLPLTQFFRVTNGLLILLAAGLASQAARYLTQADVLPAIVNSLWDTSALLSEQSLPGQMLHVLVGYTARPSAMQLIFYVTTAIAFLIGARICRPQAPAVAAPV